MYYAIISTETNQKAAIGADCPAFYAVIEIYKFFELMGDQNHE